MLRRYLKHFLLITGMVALFATAGAQADQTLLKPFVLGNTPVGNLDQVTSLVKTALAAQGFRLVGSYSPFSGAMVVCVTNGDLLQAAAKAKNGGFGAVERVAVTEVNGKLQVSYVNPTFMGVAYGLGQLDNVSAKMKTALGAVKDFGSKGIQADNLVAGKWDYGIFMPDFYQVDVLNTFADHKTAVDTVRKNLMAGKGGTKFVYEVSLPGKDVTVFGVAITKGYPSDQSRVDTDAKILKIVDYKTLRHTAYLPYEILVQGDRAIALRARFRIALYFPDTTMIGEHGFTKIMSAPRSILDSLEAVAGYKS